MTGEATARVRLYHRDTPGSDAFVQPSSVAVSDQPLLLEPLTMGLLELGSAMKPPLANDLVVTIVHEIGEAVNGADPSHRSGALTLPKIPVGATKVRVFTVMQLDS